MNNPRQALIDALNAERYGPSLWWKTPEHTAAESDAATGRTAALDLAYEAADEREETA